MPPLPRRGAGAASSQPFTLHSVDQGEREQVERLYNTLVAAKKKAGENVSGNFDSFTTFVQKKTEADPQAVRVRRTSNTPSNSPTATSNSKPKRRRKKPSDDRRVGLTPFAQFINPSPGFSRSLRSAHLRHISYANFAPSSGKISKD